MNIQKYWFELQEFFPWLIAGVTLLVGGLAVEAIVNTSIPGNWRIVYLLAFIIMVCILYLQRRAFYLPRTRYLSNEQAERRKSIILFLSNIDEKFEKTQGIPPGLQLSSDIDIDIAHIEEHKQKIKWAWEMPLRAIRHHGDKLETLALICSKKSILQVNLFLRICMNYEKMKGVMFNVLCDNDGTLQLIDARSIGDYTEIKGFDFESFDQLSNATWKLIQELKKKGYSEKDIMIDVTGGQKPTSIVGASITFNRNIKAQYVQTNPPWDVLSYDVILGSPDTSGLGI